MDIFLILLIVIGFALFANILDSNARERHRKAMKGLQEDLHGKSCPPHKWTYHPVTNRLTCTLCNFVAGQDFNPRGENDQL